MRAAPRQSAAPPAPRRAGTAPRRQRPARIGLARKAANSPRRPGIVARRRAPPSRASKSACSLIASSGAAPPAPAAAAGRRAAAAPRRRPAAERPGVAAIGSDAVSRRPPARHSRNSRSPIRLVASSTIRSTSVQQRLALRGQPPQLRLERVHPCQRRGAARRQHRRRATGRDQLVAQLLQIGRQRRQFGLDVGQRRPPGPARRAAAPAAQRRRQPSSPVAAPMPRHHRLPRPQTPAPVDSTVTARRFCA